MNQKQKKKQKQKQKTKTSKPTKKNPLAYHSVWRFTLISIDLVANYELRFDNLNTPLSLNIW